MDDAELDWMYEENTFDYIHGRNISQGIADWPKLMRQIYRLAPPPTDYPERCLTCLSTQPSQARRMG